jgi:hypothetical protein
VAPRHDIRVDQGATFRLRNYWRSPLKDLRSDDAILASDGSVIPGPPIDLTGYTGRMQVRKSVSDTVKLLDLTTANGGLLIPAPVVSMRGWCRAASTAHMTLSGAVTVDDVALAVGDRVLVKDQNTSSENGIYSVASGVWTRTTDADAAAELTTGACTWVYQGVVNGDTVWRQGSALTALTDPQSWARRSDVGMFEVLMTATQTTSLTTSGVYDIELVSPGGEVTRVLQGKVRLSAEVTRA